MRKEIVLITGANGEIGHGLDCSSRCCQKVQHRRHGCSAAWMIF